MEAQAEYEKLKQWALRPRRGDEPARLALYLALGALTGLRSHDLLRAIAFLLLFFPFLFFSLSSERASFNANVISAVTLSL